MHYIGLLTTLFLAFGVAGQKVPTFKDKRDGKRYPFVTIGTQTWMAENLNTDRFRNGDLIPEAKTKEEWNHALENQQPVWCYYNFNPDNGIIYGKIYNYPAVNDTRGLAPNGWKIPSLSDWSKLASGASQHLKNATAVVDCLRSKEGWMDGENGTNESGFNALPGGYIQVDDFEEMGQIVHFWAVNNNNVWLRKENDSRNYQIPTGSSEDGFDGTGFYVRCVQIPSSILKSKKSNHELHKEYEAQSSKYGQINGLIWIEGGDFAQNHALPMQLTREEDSTLLYPEEIKHSKMESFLLSNHEVTNGEYRQFIQWLQDSICRQQLFLNASLKEKHLWGSYTVDTTTNFDDEEKKFFHLDWVNPINYSSSEVQDKLEGIFNPSKERFFNRMVLDTRKLYYQFEIFLPEWNEYWTSTISCYPDTVAWRRLNKFSDDHMENMYFWHPAYSNYPVVGLTYMQVQAYCHWKTARCNEAVRTYNAAHPKKPLPLLQLRLPSAEEWEYASKSLMWNSTGSLELEISGFEQQKNGYTANYGKTMSRGGITIKENRDDGSLHTNRIGAYSANSRGLYDMFGNVAEWTSSVPTDPVFSFQNVLNPLIEITSDSNPRYVYVTNPYTNETAYVQMYSPEHQDILAKRALFYQVIPGDSRETIFQKTLGYFNIDPAFHQKIDSLNNQLEWIDHPNNLKACHRTNHRVVHKHHKSCLYNLNDGIFYPMNDDLTSRLNQCISDYLHNVSVISKADSIDQYPYFFSETTSMDSIPKKIKIVKGGSWNDAPHYLMSASGEVFNEIESSCEIGFRLAADIPTTGWKLTRQEKKRLKKYAEMEKEWARRHSYHFR